MEIHSESVGIDSVILLEVDGESDSHPVWGFTVRVKEFFTKTMSL